MLAKIPINFHKIHFSFSSKIKEKQCTLGLAKYKNKVGKMYQENDINDLKTEACQCTTDEICGLKDYL